MRTHRPARSSHRRVRFRRPPLFLESCEDRLLLASSGFLQGVVYLDGTSQPMPGATVLLQKLDAPSQPDQTVTTDASGVYSFTNLPAGQYRITQTPPPGYANQSSQPNSPLTPILNQTASSVDVLLGDLSQLQLSYVSRNKQILTVSSNGDVRTGYIGQMNITIDQPDISHTTTLFSTFCVDYYLNIFLGDTNLPFEAVTLEAGLAKHANTVKNPQNAGAIAYLYNHIGSTWSTDPAHYVPTAEAAGFQLALWELEYETNPAPYDVTSGSFFLVDAAAHPDVVAYAQSFLAQAQGQSELALYLDGSPTDGAPFGAQGVMAPGTLDFINVVMATPSIVTTPNLTSITLGTTAPTLTDTAVLAGGTDPTGTITFTLSLNGVEVYNETVPVNGNGSYTTPVGYTLPTTGTVTGTYQWNATYSGDAKNAPASEIDSPTERVVVQSASPAIATTPDPTSVILGASPVILKDTASLTGGYFPTGNITFTLSLNGIEVYNETVPVNGSGSYTTPVGYTLLPTASTGTYQWNATYSGDGNNLTASEIDSLTERVVVTSVSPAPTPLSGVVFVDCNDNGVLDPGEAGINGVTIILAGTDANGNTVSMTTTTQSINGQDGSYVFIVDTGTYTVTELPPAGYLNGIVSVGGAGGTVAGRSVTNIVIPDAPVNASGYNFAHLTPSSLSGFVYYDIFHNGVIDRNDYGIANVKLDLRGTNDLGQSVIMTTYTDENGYYVFDGLRPGTYDIIRQQPPIFRRYRNNVGSLGGTVTPDAFKNIPLTACTDGVNYNFGELQNPHCRLRDLAIHVGNVFYHFEQTYLRDPEGFARTYPNLVDSIAAGQVPWGKPPFPRAPLATHWVPKLGTKPIKVFPVKGIPYRPLLPATPGLAQAAAKAGVKAVPAAAQTQTQAPAPARPILSKGPARFLTARR